MCCRLLLSIPGFYPLLLLLLLLLLLSCFRGV